MSSIFLVIILTVLIFGFAAIFYLFNRKINEIKEATKPEAILSILNQNIIGMQAQIDKTRSELSNRLDKAAMVIAEVNKELGHLKEIGRSMKDFQDFFRSPKLRGNIGEQVLADLLKQILPKENYELQYTFKSGERVDAVIKTKQGIIPIDSKFPMEDFKRCRAAPTEEEKVICQREFIKAVKKHIDDIAKKYILPAEKTVDFAIMYVPSEAVYYEVVVNNDELNDYAANKKIFITSPNSFYYFLQVILIGLEGAKIEEASKQILEALKAIAQDAIRFSETLNVLNTHITNAKNAMDRVNVEYDRLSSKIDGIKLIKK